MTLLNIKLADGNEFISYNDDHYSYGGCPTCNYGSKYINEIDIRTTHFDIHVMYNQMYDYSFTAADAIGMFAVDLRSMTEKEFIDYLDKSFHEIEKPDEFKITER